ncbi:hypothetical protein [Bradyrhizobium sp. WSM471]|uniref:hypothetical protein n=1 Tax=Bradyrhizobium sp. WSM471 TaxID=319017 RepID=UPI0012F7FE9A|nr:MULTISPECIES: hypothetical protein [Bradyrhizobium]UFW43413.1 hypothetical protein BcanWSM471_10150 [Bradyrhizobium canariense]
MANNQRGYGVNFEAASSANVVFGLTSGGTLSLGDAFHFNGTISGFNDLDVIELNNFDANSASISYVQNATTGGTLTIENGAVVHLATTPPILSTLSPICRATR